MRFFLRLGSFGPPATKAVAVVLCCMLLQACSTIRLAYSQAPMLAQWRIDSYLDLSSEQAARIRGDFEDLQRWHQQVQLPRQLSRLREVGHQLSGDLSTSEACATYEAFSADARDLLARAEPTLVWLAMNLSAQQIDHLQSHLAEQRAEAALEGGGRPDAAKREDRFSEWLSRSQWLYGRLDTSQRAALAAAVNEGSTDPAGEMAWRLERDRDVVNSLRAMQLQRLSVSQVSVELRALIARVQSPVDPTHRALVSRLRTDGCRIFARLHNTTSVTQRVAAARTLADYESDFRPMVIAAQAVPAR